MRQCWYLGWGGIFTCWWNRTKTVFKRLQYINDRSWTCYWFVKRKIKMQVVGDVSSPVQLYQIMLRYSLRVLYILSTGCLQANWWVVVQDFKQNKQIKRESWCVEWYFYYLVFYFLSIRKIIQSLTKSPIYFKEEKLNFTCWLLNHDPKLALARILPLFFFVF